MKISGSHRSGEFRNLGEFRKLSTCQVPQHREQGDNTGRLKVMDNNPKTWQLQDLPVYKVLLFFPKKRPRSAEFYFSLENMQHFEGSENKLTQTRTYNVNFICIYDLTWCPVFHTQSTSMVFLCTITPWLVHNLIGCPPNIQSALFRAKILLQQHGTQLNQRQAFSTR